MRQVRFIVLAASANQACPLLPVLVTAAAGHALARDPNHAWAHHVLARRHPDYAAKERVRLFGKTRDQSAN